MEDERRNRQSLIMLELTEVMKTHWDAALAKTIASPNRAKRIMGDVVADIIMALSCSILAFTMSMMDLSEENMEQFIEHLAADMRDLYHNYLRNDNDR